jgi:hypothetical protein
MLKFQTIHTAILKAVFLACISIAACTNFIQPAQAKQASESPDSSSGDIPLVVIRFNQPRVFFEKPLRNAVAKAVQKKPSVLFDVVSYVPQGKSQSSIDAEASRHTQSIVNAMQGMGVNPNNIHTTSQPDSALQDHEVQIFIH